MSNQNQNLLITPEQSTENLILATTTNQIGRISVDIGFKLKGSMNYLLWSLRIKVLLSSLDSWDDATDKPKPTSLAHNAILHNIEETIQEQLIDAKSSTESWDILYTKFRSDTTASKIKTLQQLISHKFTSCSDSEFSLFKELGRMTTAAFGQSIKTEELIKLLALAHLPQKYNAVRINLQSQENLNLDLIEKEVTNELQLTKSTDILFMENSKQKCRHNFQADKCWKCHPNLKPKTKKKNTFINNQKFNSTSNMNTTYPNSLHLPSTSLHTNSNNNKHHYKKNVKNTQALLFVADDNNATTSEWVIDSGATRHVTNDPTLLSNTTQNTNTTNTVTVASGDTMSITAEGHIDAYYGNNSFISKEVLASTNIHYNLLSVSQLVDKGLTVTFNHDGCYIQNLIYTLTPGRCRHFIASVTRSFKQQ